jgi:hypothetical protein
MNGKHIEVNIVKWEDRTLTYTLIHIDCLKNNVKRGCDCRMRLHPSRTIERRMPLKLSQKSQSRQLQDLPKGTRFESSIGYSGVARRKPSFGFLRSGGRKSSYWSTDATMKLNTFQSNDHTCLIEISRALRCSKRWKDNGCNGDIEELLSAGRTMVLMVTSRSIRRTTQLKLNTLSDSHTFRATLPVALGLETILS